MSTTGTIALGKWLSKKKQQIHTTSFVGSRQRLTIRGTAMTTTGCLCDVSASSSNSSSSPPTHSVVHSELRPGMVVTCPVEALPLVLNGEPLSSAGAKLLRPSQSRRVVPPLPCPLAQHQQCHRCPWMTGMPEVSGGSETWKAKSLTRALATVDGDDASSLTMDPPFTFRPPLLGAEEVTLCYDAAAGGFTFFSSGRLRRVTEVDSSSSGCPWHTLEQQRLVQSLTRWSEKLPTSIRMALRGASILQHRERLVVVLHVSGAAAASGKGSETKRGQFTSSPLCGPSHPSEQLSAAENQLVDAVLTAVPLLQYVEVCVLCSGGSEPYLQRLHPHIQRTVDVAARGSEAALLTTTNSSPVGATPRRLHAYCGSMSSPFSITIPLLPSLALYLLQRTSAHHHHHPGHSSLSSLLTATPFWLHGESLESALSVWLTLLLEGISPDEGLHRAVWLGCTSAPSPPAAPRPHQKEGGGEEKLYRFSCAIGAETLAVAGEAMMHELQRTAAVTEHGEETKGRGWTLIASVLPSREAEVAAWITLLKGQLKLHKHDRRCRVLVLQCSSSLSFEPLRQVREHFSTATGSYGVIDVNPLSAAAVGYLHLFL